MFELFVSYFKSMRRIFAPYLCAISLRLIFRGCSFAAQTLRLKFLGRGDAQGGRGFGGGGVQTRLGSRRRRAARRRLEEWGSLGAKDRTPEITKITNALEAATESPLDNPMDKWQSFGTCH